MRLVVKELELESTFYNV